MSNVHQLGGIRAKGFAALSAAERRAVASRGGTAAWKKGTAHRWTSKEAKSAGRKGGLK